jgi:CheY-like chemotaxis protein
MLVEKRVRILLVDDESLLRRMVKLYLERSGFDVQDAECGEEALQMLRRESSNVDLLVTDIVMPGMSGRELAQHARDCRPDLPIVLMSGYAEHLSRISDGIPCLPKPLDLPNLVRTLESLAGPSQKPEDPDASPRTRRPKKDVEGGHR